MHQYIVYLHGECYLRVSLQYVTGVLILTRRVNFWYITGVYHWCISLVYVTGVTGVTGVGLLWVCCMSLACDLQHRSVICWYHWGMSLELLEYVA